VSIGSKACTYYANFKLPSFLFVAFPNFVMEQNMWTLSFYLKRVALLITNFMQVQSAIWTLEHKLLN